MSPPSPMDPPGSSGASGAESSGAPSRPHAFDGEQTDTRGGALRIRPVGPGKPCLIMLTGAFPGETWLLPPGAELSVGRGAGNEIRIAQVDVSRVHARLKCSASGKVDLIDLGSTNGTFVNGRRQLYRVLREGDKIQFGERTVFRFAFQDELDEEFQRRLFGAPFLDRETGALRRDRLLTAIEEHLARHEERLARQEPGTEATGQAPFGVVVMGIDGFDLLENLLGHAVRDYFLRELAWIIRKSFSGEGTLYRVGPDTFATILVDLEPDQAVRTAERIRKVVAGSRVTYEGDQMVFSLGIGVACPMTVEGAGAGELLGQAEERCRKARSAGGDRVLAAG